MKVLNITYSDYANSSHENANALRSVGVNCEDIKLIPHAYNYPTESPVVTEQVMVAAIAEADVVQIFHSDKNTAALVPASKKAVVYHTGSNYRKNPKMLNYYFNSWVEASIVALPEFVGLGAINEHYLVGAVNCENTSRPIYGARGLINFAHYPSDPNIKGSKEICTFMDLLAKETPEMGAANLFSFKYRLTPVAKEIFEQDLASCDAYIELFKPELKGKPYGSFGITALEAARAGKIVITQNLKNEHYTSAYGDNPFILVEDELDFYKKVKALMRMTQADLLELQQKTYNWVVENHAYKPTGERIKKILGL